MAATDPTPTPDDINTLQQIKNLWQGVFELQINLKELEAGTRSEQEQYLTFLKAATSARASMLDLMRGLNEAEKEEARHMASQVSSRIETFKAAAKTHQADLDILNVQREYGDLVRQISLRLEEIGLSEEESLRLKVTRLSLMKEEAAIQEKMKAAQASHAGSTVNEIDAATKILGKVVGQSWAIAGGAMQAELAAATGKTEALMRGAPGARSTIAVGGMFPVPQGIIGTVEAQAQLNKILSQAPALTKDAGEHMRALLGTLGGFGKTLEESVDIVVKAQDEQSIGAEGVAAAYWNAAGAASNMGASVSEVGEKTLALAGMLRGTGGSLGAATQIMSAFSNVATAAGLDISKSEREAAAGRFASAMGQMSLEKILGLSAFVTGQSPMNMSTEKLHELDPKTLFQEAFKKLSDMSGLTGGVSNMMLLSKFAGMAGIQGVTTPKDIEILQKVLSNATFSKTKEGERWLKDHTAPLQAINDGIRSLSKMKNPLEQIHNVTEHMQATLLDISDILRETQTNGPMQEILAAGGQVLEHPWGAAGALLGKGFAAVGRSKAKEVLTQGPLMSIVNE